MTWPFVHTPREAFLPARAADVERLWSQMTKAGMQHWGWPETRSFKELSYTVPDAIGYWDSGWYDPVNDPDHCWDHILDIVATAALDGVDEPFLHAWHRQGMGYRYDKRLEHVRQHGLGCFVSDIILAEGFDRSAHAKALIHHFFANDDDPFSFNHLGDYPYIYFVGFTEYQSPHILQTREEVEFLYNHASLQGLRSFQTENPDWQSRYREILKKVWGSIPHYDESNISQQISIDYSLARLDQLLIALVYNPGIMARIAGFTVKAIMEHLSPIVSMLVDLDGQHAADLKAKLERQAMINLFSTFPDDLDDLEATFEDILVCDPDLVKLSRQRPGLWLLHGPLGCNRGDHGRLGAEITEQLTKRFGCLSYEKMLDSGIGCNSMVAEHFDAFYHADLLMRKYRSGEIADIMIGRLWFNLCDQPEYFSIEFCVHSILYVLSTLWVERNEEWFQDDCDKIASTLADCLGVRPEVKRPALMSILHRAPQFLQIGTAMCEQVFKILSLDNEDIRWLETLQKQ